SYIHAEGYPAGEMKHGPIALITAAMPVVALAPAGPVYNKMIGNIEETRAREGQLIAFGYAGDKLLPELADHFIGLPPTTDLLSPILMSVPMQLFAYHIAVRRGCDVDQPRNLAKSVTVE
ncbi:MAG TPA: SIS domain-containing protein, partial [Chloroflexota bacterium]|nr:SIS domain-containing protein [Chloroflexota bacterium]